MNNELFNKIDERLNTKAVYARIQSRQGQTPKINKYDLRTVALLVEGIRNTPEYETTENYLIETTSSCNENEVLEWMKYYMADAFEEGMGPMDKLLRAQFLAAYDIANEIASAREARV